MRISLLACVALALCAVPGAAAEPPAVEPPGTLTLADAIAAALAASPEVRAAARDVRAHEALAMQAGALPNPELRGEVENVGGSGSRQGFEETESTVRVLQRIELGGDRAARMRVAAGEQERAAWSYEAARLAVIAATTKAFVGVLAAQERVRLATDMGRLATETAAAVERSVAVGASAPADAARACVAASRAEVERVRATRVLDGARTVLAASLNATRASFPSGEGDLDVLRSPPPEAELTAALERTPALKRWMAERKARDAAVALERARGVPDVTVGAGGRHFSDNGDNALVFEVSVPLPLFDRNRGGIVAARERLWQAKDEVETARVDARRALAVAYARLTEAYATASALAARVLPAARNSADEVLAAFQTGAVRPVDVLDARRALIEIEIERLDALERFHLAAAEIEHLTAVPLWSPTRGGDR